MSLKYTPGPWTYDPALGTIRVAHLPGVPHLFLRSDSTHADAHLIAAAPELLAALRELVRAWDERQLPVSDRMEHALASAEAAIAKATEGG